MRRKRLKGRRARRSPSFLPSSASFQISNGHIASHHSPIGLANHYSSLFPSSTMSLSPCSVSRLQALARARSTALLQPYNPLNLRTGMQYLQRPLVGEKVNSWYPAFMTDRMVQTTLDLPKTWENETKTIHREFVERKITRGKGAPKKGESASYSLSYSRTEDEEPARVEGGREPRERREEQRPS